MFLQVGKRLYNLDRYKVISVDGQSSAVFGYTDSGLPEYLFKAYTCTDYIWPVYDFIIEGLKVGKHLVDVEDVLDSDEMESQRNNG